MQSMVRLGLCLREFVRARAPRTVQSTRQRAITFTAPIWRFAPVQSHTRIPAAFAPVQAVALDARLPYFKLLDGGVHARNDAFPHQARPASPRRRLVI